MSKLKKYIEAEKQVKAGEKVKKSLRSSIIEILKRAKRFGIETDKVVYSERNRFELIEDEVYKWVASRVSPEVLEEITEIKKSINLEKLNEVYLNGGIDTLAMPSTCYKETKYSVITVGENK